MRINIFFLLIPIFLIACHKTDIVKVKSIERSKAEIEVYLENQSSKNYYILTPECQVDNGEYYFQGKLDSLDYSKSLLLDSLIYDIYKENKVSIPIILIPAKKIKKITFKYNSNITQYPNTTVYFPFNIKHEKLKVLTNTLQTKKIMLGYNFYSNTIEHE